MPRHAPPRAVPLVPPHRPLIRAAAVGLLLLAGAAPSAAQEAETCDDVLVVAQAEYVDGSFQAAADRLTTCLDSGGYDEAQQRVVYPLLAKAHLALDQEAEAVEVLTALLDLDPTYQADPITEPPRFVAFVDEVRGWVVQAEPTQAAEPSLEAEPAPRRRSWIERTGLYYIGAAVAGVAVLLVAASLGGGSGEGPPPAGSPLPPPPAFPGGS